MVANTFSRASAEDSPQVQSFDDFEMRLGDVMRGERATMGKSLLDVQRELKIKANYIAAIENADPSAFDTPGFIAGYVRSYARYLNMDPEWVYKSFCEESGFAKSQGVSKTAASKPAKKGRRAAPAASSLNDPIGRDLFAGSATPFVPAGNAPLSRVEPRAIGSLLVLGLLLAGLGYGGWAVLQEVQKVQFAPVEQTPVVVADLDPLDGATNSFDSLPAPSLTPDSTALDRLYRPQALDVPVLVARDAPISTLSPSSIGALVGGETAQGRMMAGRLEETTSTTGTEGGLAEGLDSDILSAGILAAAEAVDREMQGPELPQVVEDAEPGVTLVAVRPAWVRVQAADGTILLEGVMQAGETYEMPQTENPGALRVGESGAMYFKVGNAHYGPVGEPGQVTSGIELSAESLRGSYALAQPSSDADLQRVVALAETTPAQ